MMMTGSGSGRNMMFSEHEVFSLVPEQGNTPRTWLSVDRVGFFHTQRGWDVLLCASAVCSVRCLQRSN